jgi:peptide/nickel transport system substrate-binding protein
MQRRHLIGALVAGALALGGSGAFAQSTLRIGVADDPDILDPTLARTYVGRIVFASLCDKLFDIDANLQIVPQLATGYTWAPDNRSVTITLRPNVVFHDGERLDAEAVKFSLERHQSMQGSMRRGEISVMQSVEVVDPLTVRVTLSSPFAPFIAQLTDRAGMIVSPKAARAAGPDFGNRPVCAGPYRFVERVAQDHITVERFDRYWNPDAIHIDRVIFQTVTDSTVRLTNLQAGALDMIERVAPSDVPAIQRNNRMALHVYTSLGYQGITINVANGDRARAPIGADPRVREAFDLAIDREALNQVVYNGMFTPTAQAVPPANPFHVRSVTAPARNLDRARALLRETGLPTPVVINMLVANNPLQRQEGEVIQAMAREAGFDVRVQATEFASMLQAAQRGEFEAELVGWSGRVDPDGNIYSFLVTGQPLNDGRWSNADFDRLMNQARQVTDRAQRLQAYEQAATIMRRERPIIYIYHNKLIVAHTARLSGFQEVPDGLIRPQGLRLAN